MARNSVRVSSGRAFGRGASGKWAGEQLLRAAKQGRPINAAVLRTNDVLRHEEWKAFDNALLEEAQIQLKGIADLVAGGLTIPVANSMGKTVFGYERATDIDDADVSMDPVTRGMADTTEFDMSNIALPFTHKDFYIHIRKLIASRTLGESLDTTMIRLAGRKVAQKSEKMLFQGGPTFGGLPIYGYTTHPNRNTVSFGTNGVWTLANVAKTGDNIVTDVQSMMSANEDQRQYGPFWLYVPRNSNLKLDQDFKANGSLTIRQRLLQLDGLDGIKAVDQLPANNIILVQHTMDTVALLQGETLQTIQWDVEGGFHINFKAFQIQVPLIRADIQGRCGVAHMS